jgi:serine/threonine-protein kinase
VPVPNVLGVPLPTAQARLEAAGLKAETTEDFSRDVPAGNIAGQEPPANARLEQGQPVKLTVSKGPQRGPVPNVIGEPIGTAADRLARAGFTVKRQDAHTTLAAPGVVFEQSPRVGEADLGSEVTVRVSLGREQAVVPRVLGQPEAVARERLGRDGFVVEVTHEPSSTVEWGVVFAQEPPPDAQVDKGATVRLRVRRDPTPTAAPPTPTSTPSPATATRPAAVATAPTAPTAQPAATAATGQPTRPAGASASPGGTTTAPSPTATPGR